MADIDIRDFDTRAGPHQSWIGWVKDELLMQLRSRFQVRVWYLGMILTLSHRAPRVAKEKEENALLFFREMQRKVAIRCKQLPRKLLAHPAILWFWRVQSSNDWDGGSGDTGKARSNRGA
jgi:hypothetical protein